MARIRIAELQYNVVARTNDFLKGMRQVEGRLRYAQRQVKNLGESLTRSLAPATAAVIGLAVAGQRLGNSLESVSEELGINTTALQALRQVTAQNGETNERLTKSLRNITDRTAQAAAGNESMLRHFRALNIDIDKFIKLPTERRLEEIAKAQASATNEAEAHAAVMGIVGVFSGPKMMRTLRDLARRGYGEVERAAQRAGMVMQRSTIDKMAEINQKIEDVILQARIFGAELAVYVIRPLEKLDKALGVSSRIGELTHWFTSLDEEAKKLIGTISLFVATIGPLILVLAATLTPLIAMVGMLAKLKAAFLAGWAVIKAGIGVLTLIGAKVIAIVAVFGLALAAVLAFTGALDGIGKSLIGERLTVQLKIFSLRLIQTASDWGLELVKQIGLAPRYIAAAIGSAMAYVNWQFSNGLLDTIVDVAGAVVDKIGGAFRIVGTAFFNLISNLFDVYINSVKQSLNFLIRQVNKNPFFQIDTLEVQEGLTFQSAVADAVKPLADALFAPSSQTGDSFSIADEFRSRLGDTSTGVPAMISDLQDRIGDGIDGLIETQRERLDVLNRAAEEAGDSVRDFSEGLQSATGSLGESAEYSDEARELAQKTLDQIKAGRLSTTRETREEAEAILRGEAIYGDSVRFRRFATMQRPDASYVRDGAEAVGLGDWSSLDAGPSWERSGRRLVSWGDGSPIEPKVEKNVRNGDDTGHQIVAAVENMEGKMDELAEAWKLSFAPN